MTGKDDGGFSPHPGDPWHPSWRAEDDGSDDAGEHATSATDDTTAKRGRFGRRRKERDGAGVEQPEPEARPARRPADPEMPQAGEDPFDAVLRAEGRSVRRRPSSGSDAPQPEWTSDEELPDDLTLPVAPPSWVGDTTATDPAIEASGFEPIEAAPAATQPDLFAPPDQAPPPAEEATPGDEPIVSDEPAIAGEYGVAGSEAFSALADTAESDLPEWEAFMGGAEPLAAGPAPATRAPVEPVGDDAAFDEWVESEPEQKRGWFRRRGKGAAEVPSPSDTHWDDADQVWEDAEGPSAPVAAPEEPQDDRAFMPPEPVAFDDTDPARGPADDLDEDSAVAQALAALGGEPDVADDAGVAWSAEDPEVAWDEERVEVGSVPVTDLADQELLVQPASDHAVESDGVGEVEAAAALEADADERGDVEAAPVHLGEAPSEEVPLAEDVPDWDGDPSRVPASWFADVDEDSVVPPVVADTPETEWAEPDGPWEGRAAWDSQADTEVFDVEAGLPRDDRSLDVAAGYEQPVIPEGYQPWEEAVAEAMVDGGGEETAEYHVQHVAPPPPRLPEGFEPFPGTEAEAAYGGGSPRPEGGWMPETTDDTLDPAAPAAFLDEDGDETEFDEGIYAGGGTLEHRGLAEAIAAAAEDDDTAWQAMSAAMPGVETGVLGFEDVADLASSGDEYVAPVRSNLGMRVLTGLILGGSLIGSLLAGAWVFALFVAAILLLGLGEMYATLSRTGYLPLTVFGMVGAGSTLAATWFHGPIAIPAGVMLTSVVIFFYYAFAPTRRDALTNGGVTVLGLAWVIGGVGFAIPIGRSAEADVIVLAIVATTAAMDIGAYTFGRRFGRRALAPVLSPNKTVEGLMGGTLAAFVVGGVVGFFEWGPFDLVSGLALAALVVVFAPLGDLAESMVKRSIGVKDMGSTLPGHGGVLDRIDALVLVIPAAWVLLEVLGYLG